MRALRAGWLSLLREIRLGSQPEGGRKTSFIAVDLHPFAPSLTVTWWRTPRAERSVKLLAASYLERAERGHHELMHVVELIQRTLQERCLDPGVFEGVLTAPAGSLFDRLAVAEADAVDTLHAAMEAQLLGDSGRWVAIHPLYRIVGASVDLGFANLRIVRPDDESYWRSLNGGRVLANWSPLTGHLTGSAIGFREGLFHAWLVGEYQGSKEGVRQRYKRDAQQAMAAVYAFWSEDRRRHRVAQVAQEHCLLLQDGPLRSGYELSGLGRVYPCYGDENEVALLAPRLRAWNLARAALSADAAQRLGNALCFVNLAMGSDDIAYYLHYFIALDALFGVRGRVEDSIVEGVRRVSALPAAADRAAWLFELRNELVHGGSRNVHEWPRYPDYLRHFDTEPERDIEAIVLDCLRRYPDAYAPGAPP
ncbi:hypothetical protein ASE35_15470 [Lysobacter sp. Root916]|uniref:hypothetical protein n=1 Tax=Lysobacter sp. Root916 TaxID=1736606 RepID=UPI00070FBD2B|nr:hypothetical protein [Lysobacter sp. Root916]KRD31401.1 hypothetical protein ASE35_15470 [Lysobacter sp. Root916]